MIKDSLTSNFDILDIQNRLSKLCGTAVNMYYLIQRLCSSSEKKYNVKYCFISNEKFASIVNRSISSVQRALKVLKKYKLITIDYNGAYQKKTGRHIYLGYIKEISDNVFNSQKFIKKSLRSKIYEIIDNILNRLHDEKKHRLKTAFILTFGKITGKDSKRLMLFTKKYTQEDIIKAIEKADILYNSSYRSAIHRIKQILKTLDNGIIKITQNPPKFE